MHVRSFCGDTEWVTFLSSSQQRFRKLYIKLKQIVVSNLAVRRPALSVYVNKYLVQYPNYYKLSNILSKEAPLAFFFYNYPHKPKASPYSADQKLVR
jgi:hypothetical protein